VGQVSKSVWFVISLCICFQVCPCSSAPMVVWDTPYCLAMSMAVGCFIANILRTSASVNLAVFTLAPTALIVVFSLPLFHISLILSACVPSTRCAGFMQLLLSQICITIFPRISTRVTLLCLQYSSLCLSTVLPFSEALWYPDLSADNAGRMQGVCKVAMMCM